MPADVALIQLGSKYTTHYGSYLKPLQWSLIPNYAINDAWFVIGFSAHRDIGKFDDWSNESNDNNYVHGRIYPIQSIGMA